MAVRTGILWLFACCFASGGALSAEPLDPAGIEFFEKRIRPVLADHCYECHAADAKVLRANLRLDTRDGLRRGGDSGPAIMPGKAEESLLIQALKYDGLEMPPKQQLPQQVVTDFQRWIEMGAPDPRANKAASQAAKSATDHWAVQPLSPAEPPKSTKAWAYGDVDAFILMRLVSEGLTPAGDAPPTVWLRRVCFDLIGLPPEPAEIDAFLAEARGDPHAAKARVVDRLLASPHFGERWGRHWLDLARYSESNGGDRNVIWQHAWRYRNYVIDALNADVPYDQFVREQIAGDLLPAADPDQRDRQRIATGLLTLGPKLFMETDQERFQLDVADEQIDVITRGILGLTVSCARCHDHKFDPIPTRDYYALAGIFTSTEELRGPGAPAGNQYGHDRPLQPVGPDGEKLQGPAEAWKKSVAEQTAKRNKARSDRYRIVRSVQASENKLKMLSEGKSEAELAASEEIAALRGEIEKQQAEIREWDEKIAAMDAELKTLEANPPPLPDCCMAVRDARQPADTAIRLRGDPKRHGEPAPRGMLSLIEVIDSPPIGAQESGRRQLAAWLTDPRNPLTPRVAVNRVWRHLFGEGLVRSVDNFGVMGETPTHPELLDWLAAGFQQQGWSVKQLIRQMVLSRTYGLASSNVAAADAAARDPDNRLLWRAHLRRLDAEAIRDALLAVSGRLQRQTLDASTVATFTEAEFNDRVKLTAAQLNQPCRTIYLPIARMALPDMLELFDFADPSLVIGRRTERTTPDQQLFFLNNSQVAEWSRATAGRVLQQSELSTSQRIELAYRLCLSREPREDECRRAQRFLTEFVESPEQFVAPAAIHMESEPRLLAWSFLCHSLLASAEFRHLE